MDLDKARALEEIARKHGRERRTLLCERELPETFVAVLGVYRDSSAANSACMQMGFHDLEDLDAPLERIQRYVFTASVQDIIGAQVWDPARGTYLEPEHARKAREYLLQQ